MKKLLFPFSILYQKWKNLKVPFKVVLILVVIALIATTSYIITTQLLKSDNLQLEKLGAKKNIAVTMVPPSPTIPKYSPINGIEIANTNYQVVMDRHPLAVVVNNHKDARPQSGLSAADSVLEVLAEGGITRYVAIYHNNYDVSKVGPIRSLRYYMIEFASGYSDAMILHHGWAGFDGAAFERYNARTDARGAVSKFGIKDIHTEASTYRDPVKAKKSGYVHALYTDFTRINKEIDRLSKASGWDLGVDETLSLKFKEDAPVEARGLFQSVDVKFISLSTSDYTARFTYDKATNTYPRLIGGIADVDELTNTQISPKNVIIEWHNYADANDGHSRIVIDMEGQDKATILRDGEVVEATWKKECRTCRTRYYDTLGEEVLLNRGQIWIVNAIKVQERLISTVDIK